MAVAIFCGLYWWEISVWFRLRDDFSLLRLRNDQGYAEFRHRPTNTVMVLLPGGRFLMGSPDGEPGSRDDERPRHEVTLSPFLIAKHEISQSQWRQVMSENPSTFEGDDLPVETVSWKASQEFCRRVGLLLPTEAQWEYACRAGAERPFGVGSGTEITPALDVFGQETTAPVGSGAPNRFGLYNLHGNVREWCRDPPVRIRTSHPRGRVEERSPRVPLLSTARGRRVHGLPR